MLVGIKEGENHKLPCMGVPRLRLGSGAFCTSHLSSKCWFHTHCTAHIFLESLSKNTDVRMPTLTLLLTHDVALDKVPRLSGLQFSVK